MNTSGGTGVHQTRSDRFTKPMWTECSGTTNTPVTFFFPFSSRNMSIHKNVLVQLKTALPFPVTGLSINLANHFGTLLLSQRLIIEFRTILDSVPPKITHSNNNS
jgi:hypothetical protein